MGIALVLARGTRLESARPVATTPAVEAVSPATSQAEAAEPLRRPLPILLLQIIVIVAVARALGAAFARLGQPPVIGEIVAGIVLGPSVFGASFPKAFAFLFAPSSVGLLKLIAELGVLLFLFAVGVELDLGRLRSRARTAVFVSHASIVVPYFLGVATSLVLYPGFAPAGVGFVPFALFMGIATSITAFPVLVRILRERGLSGTLLGDTAVTCAAVDDVTAWSLLAVVVAIAGSKGWRAAASTIALSAAFIAAMLFVIGPWVRRRLAGAARRTQPGKSAVAFVLGILLASALATELIGIHALFGAFLAGVVMPRESRFRAYLTERLEEFSSVFLLPLFFAFTGLRTRIGLLNDGRAWLLCALVIVVATVGKLGGSMVAARLTGTSWGDAFALGALMNSRGLMELIALNVGYELGILSPQIFAIMVLMAIATTFATSPLLSLSERWRTEPSADRDRERVVVQRDQRP
ncbi:MAG TPA: cation:proton antiporter [Thermoanaerobaculia bacterium]|nr:cation:proton antiporter [Thermoanaerobaculia bacterium]